MNLLPHKYPRSLRFAFFCSLTAAIALPIFVRVRHQRTELKAPIAREISAGKDEREAEEREATNGEGLLHERYSKRLDSKESIPQNALVNAKLYADTMREAVWYGVHPEGGLGIQDGGITYWEWLGPGNVGGRIRSIVFLSNTTVLIGATSGGIWRSTDTGATWSPMSDFIASLNVSCMAADPTNTNIVYAGTGEGFAGAVRSKLSFVPGVGIFKSTNGGGNWTQLANTTSWQYVYRIAHHPTQANTLLAATFNGLFRSTDGGTNWTSVLGGSWQDVKYNPADPSLVLAATSGMVSLSTNYGLAGSWTTLTTGGANRLPTGGGRCELAIATNGTMYVSMDINTGTSGNPLRGSLYRSTDGGVNWNRRAAFDYLGGQGGYANAIWVAPDDSNHVIVGGLDLWRSTDGGANFTQISNWTQYHLGQSAHADQHTVVSPPNYSVNNRSVYFGNDGGIQRANNVTTVAQTSGWTNLANGLGITQFYGVAVAPDGSNIIAGAQDNDTQRFRPASGVNGWYQAKTGDSGYCVINPNNTSIFYDEYVNLAIGKSTNSGDSYTSAVNGLTDAATNALFIAPFILDPTNSNVLVAGGESLWRTTNAAVSWGQTRGPQSNVDSGLGTTQCSALAIANGNTNLIWAGYTDGRISRTNGSNVTLWSNVQDNGTLHPPHRWVTSIAINPKNSNEVFVTVGGFATDTVWFTADNGANWENRNGNGTGAAMPAVQVNCITFHPDDPNTVYVGTDVGIFASDTKGRAWSRTPRYINAWSNDGPNNVEVSQFAWQGSSLVAATYGRGVYRTKPYNVIYVDKNNAGSQDGSRAHPYRTVQQGINAAVDGTLIVIIANDYGEGYKFTNKRIRIVTENGAARVH